MAQRRGLSEADIKLWAAYSQTLNRLMPGRARLPVEPQMPVPAAQVGAEVAAPVQVPKVRAAHRPVSLEAIPAGLDKSTWKKFASGKIRAEQRLDLHGHTAARAHHEVSHFIERAYGAHLRCIEIITGKGEILAHELPHWLNTPGLRPLILAIAHPHAANTGSVRILLRRVR
ncbi:MAG TPA: Smr/MutS family protein [Acidocella sp.]|nr:MAG: hypothetical protein B7Z81_02025 [Acidocella sp. 20-61-6]HQT47141.1 Smr/MutS family protein [Acidocella sp.]